ncbi:MAG: hypothetical protein P1U58_08395 [Verrucomicrobiales bacterium]|nr:hypothetical protein [Verrucomicrobiales bacterium]
MTDPDSSPVSLAVLNPRGRDPFLDFQELPAEPSPGVHAPINFHAYAAATRGAFFDSTAEVISQRDRFDAVLLLIRKRTWISLIAARILKSSGIPVIVAWKECSESQIAKQLRSLRARMAYRKIIALADGILSPTLTPPPKPSGIDAHEFSRKLRMIPTPYPLELPGWDFSRPLESRSGILIGTREFKTSSRNHLRAIQELITLVEKVPVPRVTVINTEGKNGSRQLHALTSQFPEGVFQIIEAALPYPNYMRLLATHRVVFQRDLSGVPGQVAGDCLLARTLCAGGNSTLEKITFPEFSAGEDGSIDRLAAVLVDDAEYASAIEKSQRSAEDKLSYAAAARAFADWDISL